MNFILIYYFAAHFSAFACDPFGNAYAISANHFIQKIDSSGKVVATSAENSYGRATSIDAGNPLCLTVFYKDYNRVLFLDNTLNVVQELNLSTALLHARTLCAGPDNNLWMYDEADHKVKQTDRSGKLLHESVDLLNQFGYEINPVFMAADGDYVFVCDTTEGIYLFDLYGSEVMNIPLKGVRCLQPRKQEIIYVKGTQLIRYNFRTFETNTLDLPTDVAPQQVYLSYNKTFVLLRDQLLLYRFFAE